MQANPPQPKRRQETQSDKLTLSFGILASALIAWLFSEKFTWFERVLSQNLFGHQGISSIAASETSPGAALMRIGIICGFATASAVVGYKVSQRLRWIVFIQFLALNLVLHLVQKTLFANSNDQLAMPISLALAAGAGLGFGSFVKRLKDTRLQLIAKDSALETIRQELLQSKIQLVKDDEVERRVLAADLHDQVLNDLKLLRKKASELTSETESKITELDELIVNSMNQIREVMDSLSPAVLKHLGFIDALEDCVRSGADRADYKVRFRSSVDASEFEVFNEIETTLLYRLVQETVTNICKHANATTVKCLITADSGNLKISIIDDGVGMDASARSTQSRGLRFMQQRASLINAHVIWLPGENNKGTKVDITIAKPR
jgi:signal transduction histidine kinase